MSANNVVLKHASLWVQIGGGGAFQYGVFKRGEGGGE